MKHGHAYQRDEYNDYMVFDYLDCIQRNLYRVIPFWWNHVKKYIIKSDYPDWTEKEETIINKLTST